MSSFSKDSPVAHQGRRGEILQIATLARFGFIVLDAAGSTNKKAPLLHRYQFSFIAPDAMSIRTGPLWMEFKTKRHHEEWGGGSPLDNPKVNARTEEGINERSYASYLATQEATKIPVVLMILSIDEGELLGHTLSGLGQPRYSTSPRFPLVNWDVREFRRLCRFDPKRLHDYFFNEDGSHRVAPADIPPSRQLRRLLDYLRPEQDEFESIMQDIVDQLDKEWHG